jgi:hypothetical protein
MSKIKLTDKQILRLKRSLAKIYKLRNEILPLADEPASIHVLKKRITELLLLLEEMASYSNPRNTELDTFLRDANMRFLGTDMANAPWPATEHEIHQFCRYLNSLVFNFTNEGVQVLS